MIFHMALFLIYITRMAEDLLDCPRSKQDRNKSQRNSKNVKYNDRIADSNEIENRAGAAKRQKQKTKKQKGKIKNK